ncbi:MAG: cytochrome C [Thermomicrobiales bacterium]|nr:cytochrome C [Thermomicrobiales bacterium]
MTYKQESRKTEMSVANAAPVNGATIDKPKAERRTLALERVRASWLQLTMLIAGSGLLIGSIFFPYWNIVLRAPQYPKGLSVDVWVNKLTDMRSVREVDGLNHYIGMIKLTDAAKIERAISVYAIVLVAILAIVSTFLPGWWRTLARLPMAVYPVLFAVDMFAWLYYAGHSLDPKAALSSSIHEFTPRILGTGEIGQFKTEAAFQTGFWMAVAAMVLAIVAIALDWRARRHVAAP